MLKALLWKDLRVNRLPLLMCATLFIAPYILAAAAVMQVPLWQEASTSSGWAVVLATGAYFSIMCSQASLAMLSGHLIAVERSDRSAEFIAYLPPTRLQLLSSKLMVLATAVAVVWGGNFAVQKFADLLAFDLEGGARALTAEMASLGTLAAIGTLAIGAGWCATCMLSGTGTAVAFAMCAPMVLVGVLLALGFSAGWPDQFSFGAVYVRACWVMAILFFVIGSAHYLRRIEP